MNILGNLLSLQALYTNTARQKSSTGFDLVGKFRRAKIVPDVIRKAPGSELEVYFCGGVHASGNILSVNAVQNIPIVQWKPDHKAIYTLAFVDPDAPSRRFPRFREWNHWLVVNIPSNNVCKGQTLVGYYGSDPPAGSGLHRYVFLLYKQRCMFNFEEKIIKSHQTNGRKCFCIREFAKKYNFGDPIAGNFYQCERAYAKHWSGKR